MIQANWTGPYAWPTFENINKLNAIPDSSGVYLWTFEYKAGYLIYAAGVTRRSFKERFREHTQKYMNGEYNVLDIVSVQKGIRKEIWHGWGYAQKHRDEFKEKRSIIIEAVHKQLMGFRVFVTDIGKKPRILERLEAAIMNTLYKQPPPICNIPDKGMQLAPRWQSEEIISVKNECPKILLGLPGIIEI